MRNHSFTRFFVLENIRYKYCNLILVFACPPAIRSRAEGHAIGQGVPSSHPEPSGRARNRTRRALHLPGAERKGTQSGKACPSAIRIRAEGHAIGQGMPFTCPEPSGRARNRARRALRRSGAERKVTQSGKACPPGDLITEEGNASHINAIISTKQYKNERIGRLSYPYLLFLIIIFHVIKDIILNSGIPFLFSAA